MFHQNLMLGEFLAQPTGALVQHTALNCIFSSWVFLNKEGNR